MALGRTRRHLQQEYQLTFLYFCRRREGQRSDAQVCDREAQVGRAGRGARFEYCRYHTKDFVDTPCTGRTDARATKQAS